MLKRNALPVMFTVIFTMPWKEHDSNQLSVSIFDNCIEKQHTLEALQKKEKCDV